MRPPGSYREPRKGRGRDRLPTRGGIVVHAHDPGHRADQGVASAGGAGTAGQGGPPCPACPDAGRRRAGVTAQPPGSAGDKPARCCRRAACRGRRAPPAAGEHASGLTWGSQPGAAPAWPDEMSEADGILEDMSARMRSPVLVGRAEHLAVLDTALDRARAGGPSALLIGGEAGIGKSRLVSEFAAGRGRDRRAGAGRRLPGSGRRRPAVRAVRRGAPGACPRSGRRRRGGAAARATPRASSPGCCRSSARQTRRRTRAWPGRGCSSRC